MMPERYSARLLVLAVAILFSTGGTAIKACDFMRWQVAGLRSGIAVNTIFLQSSAPLYILLMSPILLKEAARLRDGVVMILVAAGQGRAIRRHSTSMAEM